MVIRVMVEGGAISADPTQTRQHNAMIQRNSAALRESLNGFFSRALDHDDIEIKVSVASGYKAAAKLFLSQPEEDFWAKAREDFERFADKFGMQQMTNLYFGDGNDDD